MSTNQIFAVSTFLIITIIAISIYRAKKKQARFEMRHFGRHFKDDLGCPEASGYYYRAIRLHNFFGILFSEIGYRDSDEFHKVAINALQRSIDHVKTEFKGLTVQFDDLINRRGQLGRDVDQELTVISEALKRSKQELDRLELSMAYLKEPHVFPKGQKLSPLKPA